MLDDYSKRQVKTILEKELEFAAEEYGGAIPRHFIRVAFNNIHFSGDLLLIDNTLQQPNAAFFMILASRMQLVFTNLGQKNIYPTKQDMDDMLNSIHTGLVE